MQESSRRIEKEQYFRVIFGHPINENSLCPRATGYANQQTVTMLFLPALDANNAIEKAIAGKR